MLQTIPGRICALWEQQKKLELQQWLIKRSIVNHPFCKLNGWPHSTNYVVPHIVNKFVTVSNLFVLYLWYELCLLDSLGSATTNRIPCIFCLSVQFTKAKKEQDFNIESEQWRGIICKHNARRHYVSWLKASAFCSLQKNKCKQNTSAYTRDR